MSAQQRWVAQVRPVQEIAVAPEDLVDEALAEEARAGGAVLVPDLALGREQHLPAVLPGAQREVEILAVEGIVHLVQAAQREPLAPIEGAGAATAPEDGNELRRLFWDGVVAIVEHAVLEAGPR